MGQCVSVLVWLHDTMIVHQLSSLRERQCGNGAVWQPGRVKIYKWKYCIVANQPFRRSLLQTRWGVHQYPDHDIWLRIRNVFTDLAHKIRLYMLRKTTWKKSRHYVRPQISLLVYRQKISYRVNLRLIIDIVMHRGVVKLLFLRWNIIFTLLEFFFLLLSFTTNIRRIFFTNNTLFFWMGFTL